MAGLSFGGSFGSAGGNPFTKTSFGGFALGKTGAAPSSSGLSMGTPVLARSPTDFQYPKAAPYDDAIMRAARQRESAPKTTAPKPKLTFGSAIPAFTPVFSRVNKTPLSYGSSVPKIDTSNRFGTGSGGLSNFLQTFSLGTPVQTAKSPTDFQYPSTARSTPPFISSPAQVDTVTLAGGAGMADAAKDLAGQIFSDMLTPANATPAGGAGAQFGGGQAGGGGFMDNIGTTEIVVGAVALGVVFMLASGGGSSRRAPARRKKR